MDPAESNSAHTEEQDSVAVWHLAGNLEAGSLHCNGTSQYCQVSHTQASIYILLVVYSEWLQSLSTVMLQTVSSMYTG